MKKLIFMFALCIFLLVLTNGFFIADISTLKEEVSAIKRQNLEYQLKLSDMESNIIQHQERCERMIDANLEIITKEVWK